MTSPRKPDADPKVLAESFFSARTVRLRAPADDQRPAPDLLLADEAGADADPRPAPDLMFAASPLHVEAGSVAGVRAADGGGSAAPRNGVTPQRRWPFSWSTGQRWSAAVSVVLLAVVVGGAVVFAQGLAENAREAEALAAGFAELETAEATAASSQPTLEEAMLEYDAAAASALAIADSAGPALDAVAGMSDETARAAASAALAGLITQLDRPADAMPRAAYERGELDQSSLDAIAAATEVADGYAQRSAAALREVRGAQTLLREKLDALTAAQVALGSSLPATAASIVAENPDAAQALRDAVLAASGAVGAAQAAGGSGDAELLAYAAMVTGVRGDQARADAERSAEPVTPPRRWWPAPRPAPEPEPVPAPAPEPVPEPIPDPPVDPPEVPVEPGIEF